MAWYVLADTRGRDFYVTVDINYRKAIGHIVGRQYSDEEARMWRKDPASFGAEPSLFRNGIYIYQEPQYGFYSPTSIPCSLFEVEPQGEVEALPNFTFKAVRMKVIREVTMNEFDSLLGVPYIEFLRFIEQPPPFQWFSADNNSDPRWKLFTAPTLAEAREKAMKNGREAFDRMPWSFHANERIMASLQFVAENFGKDMLLEKAKTAVWDTVFHSKDLRWIEFRSIAGAMPYSFADSMALYAIVNIVLRGLPVYQQDRDHILRRWEVWRKGYGLLYDISGIFYVFGIGPMA